MRQLVVLLAGATLCAAALATPPTEQSIDKLMEVSRTPKLMEQMIPMMVQSMRRGMEEASKETTPTEEQQRTMNAVFAKVEQSMREALSWDALHPMFIQIYQETFTQSDIDGLIAFYQSPTGAAYIEKMPIALKKTQALVQKQIGPLVQKLRSDIEKTVADSKSGQ
jgi:hypothetical protein